MIVDVEAKEAWDQLKEDKRALLVDVRTPEEWEKVGYPDLSSLGKEVIKDSLQDKIGRKNNSFIQNLKNCSIEQNQPLFFICLIGGRSRIAASLAQEAGFKNVYNIKFGFEGPANEKGKRGLVAGWLASKLPFKKSV